MLKKLIYVGAIFLSVVCMMQTLEAKNRKVAVQTYSLNRFTLEEAIEKLKDMGLDGIECYPGQKISNSMPDQKMGPGMSEEAKAFVKKMLKDANLKIVSFGVTGADNEAQIRKLCEFAKEFGFDRILTEGRVSTFEIWEKVGKEYGVTMCLHHHALDSGNQYFDPDLVMKYTKDLKYVKANPDVGHWSRCKINPIDALRKLKGNIGSVHFKDQKKFGDKGNNCVPFGEGELNCKAMLAELDKQGYDGFYVIEYEADWNNNVDKIRKCVEFLRKN